MHGLIFNTSISLLAGSTRELLIYFLIIILFNKEESFLKENNKKKDNKIKRNNKKISFNKREKSFIKDIFFLSLLND